ncbi:MAG TPA: cytochrome c [Candidatus Acidoferrum sp.]|nr:cytochrome c [Candidatus Acidoferrum sp.]
MRLHKGFVLSALVAVAVPTVVALTAISTLADSTPSPSGSAVPLPGNPTNGASLFAQTCTACHGVNLEGSIGPALNPIFKLPGVSNPLDPNFIIGIITNGRVHQPGDPGSINMPVKGNNTSLTDQDIKDIAAFIIQQNSAGSPPLAANALAERTILWVGIAIVGMLFITLLLSQYNMRWIARRAAAHRK